MSASNSAARCSRVRGAAAAGAAFDRFGADFVVAGGAVI
jgi:hypothetical protein